MDFKPGVQLQSIDKSELCVGMSTEIRYRTVGTFEASNTFSFYLVPYNNNTAKLPLGTAKSLSGKFAFTVPASLKEGIWGNKQCGLK